MSLTDPLQSGSGGCWMGRAVLVDGDLSFLRKQSVFRPALRVPSGWRKATYRNGERSLEMCAGQPADLSRRNRRATQRAAICFSTADRPNCHRCRGSSCCCCSRRSSRRPRKQRRRPPQLPPLRHQRPLRDKDNTLHDTQPHDTQPHDTQPHDTPRHDRPRHGLQRQRRRRGHLPRGPRRRQRGRLHRGKRARRPE